MLLLLSHRRPGGRLYIVTWIFAGNSTGRVTLAAWRRVRCGGQTPRESIEAGCRRVAAEVGSGCIELLGGNDADDPVPRVRAAAARATAVLTANRA
jgi:hypothetical protein